MLTIVIPIYNERTTLRACLERLLKTELPVPFEVILVDDGSADDGLETVSDLASDERISVVVHEANRGKGAAVRSGIESAKGDLLTIMDADLEYDPADYSELLAPILNGGAEVVYGTRTFGAHTAFSFWYVLGNRFVSFWASFLFNTWLTDVETCFKLATTQIWRSLDLRSKGFEIEAESTGKFLKAGHRIYEVPIAYRARTRMEGKKLRWTDGVNALWTLLRVRLFARVPSNVG
ncbi:MAG: glycosyltransferase [Actinobacteria bacterium]|nr:glycosyltransferase [Actinomycetota bacterium]